ncbi:MAG: hypothetical protein L6R41_003580 [Letrouitia leprolyta]|nr:MAG: hypothetical protein L6R41_003580 [Letrouitia leprolyta]
MSKPASVFAGGWSADKAAKLANVQLPDKTRCKGCHKLKALGLFSNKQLTDLRQRVAGPHGEKAKAPTAEVITCRTCTSGQIQELTCFICNETKGLEAFGKTQRKDPDRAGMQKWADRDWNNEDSAGEASDDDEYSRTITTNPYDTASYQRDDTVSAVSSALKEVNLAAPNNSYGHKKSQNRSTFVTQSDLFGSYRDAGGPSERASDIKGKGKERETNWQSFAATQRPDPVVFTGYDSKSGAHRQVHSPSVAAREQSVEIVTDKPRGRSNVSKPKGGKHAFAKPPRGPSPEMRKDSVINSLKNAAVGRTVSYSDDEYTDDE